MSSSATHVSVIITFLDAERFLREAVESVFSQTHPFWELILVDDGSSDGGSELAKGYAASHPERIRYLTHPDFRNRGISASRNLGIRCSSGDFVAFLDADDVWLPEKLSGQLKVFEAWPEASMVFGTPLYWHGWTGLSEDVARDTIPRLWIPPECPIAPPRMLISSYPLGDGQAPCPSDLLVRRELLKRVGGFEEAFAGIHNMFEDQAFLAKAYLDGIVVASDTFWTKYRIHADSCVAKTRSNGQGREAKAFYLSWLASHLKREGVEDREVLGALGRAIRKHHRPDRPWISRQAHRLGRLVRRAI